MTHPESCAWCTLCAARDAPRVQRMTHVASRRVIAADIEDSRLELAKQMGADVVVNSAKKDLVEVRNPPRVCERDGA